MHARVRAVGWAAGGVDDDSCRGDPSSQAGAFRGERFSFPVADVNAAGSLYALAAVIALGYAWLQHRQRILWLAALVILMPAIWLSGSRSAYLAIAAGAAVLAVVRHQWQPTRRHLALGGTLFLAAMLAAGFLVDPQSETEGSAEQSVNLRSQFLLTSARMFASAPAFGVGVGRYFEQSADFMTPELRDLYGNENAHNYFAQQFAELGLVGGLLFVWLVAIVLTHAWRAALRSPGDVSLARAVCRHCRIHADVRDRPSAPRVRSGASILGGVWRRGRRVIGQPCDHHAVADARHRRRRDPCRRRRPRCDCLRASRQISRRNRGSTSLKPRGTEGNSAG